MICCIALSMMSMAGCRDKAAEGKRHLPLQGGYNFRDLGGYRTTDGHYVKWRMILRSDDLSGLTADDVVLLDGIPVRTVVDFRSPSEVSQAPDRQLSGPTARYELPISPGDLSDAGGFMSLSADSLRSYMRLMNEEMVSRPEFVAQFRELFRLLQEEGNAPLLFHCTAGKDRTGMGAALVLYALGVDEATVMEDYLLSNEYILRKYEGLLSEYPNLEPVFTVRSEYLLAGIDRIRRDHGSVEAFLENELGTDLGKLRKMYTSLR